MIVAAVPVNAAVSVPEAVTTVTSVPAVGRVPAANVRTSPERENEGSVPAEPKGVTVSVVSAPFVIATVPAGV